MSSKQGPDHVVVDGSNIATEGRSLPSLKQLQEAVMSFMDEYPDTAVTVVVDATFGHRIDKKESKEFEEGIANNELVAPPAGAVGRGDAFVLGIADKAGASVLSNDSFQEFHGEYEWLFDEGRLIGGKPVPHVGWVWVDRVPVRGPVSRKATSKSASSRRGRGSSKKASSGSKAKAASKPRRSSKAASEPMPVPTSPPPTNKKQTAATTSSDAPPAPSSGKAPKGDEPVNDLMPFLDFVESNPVGTDVTATVDAYSSHGAYVMIGDPGVRAYVPLRLMDDPPPRSARKAFSLGDTVELVVVSFAAARRSIDCAVPALAAGAIDQQSDAGDGSAPTGDSSGEDAPTRKTAATTTATKRTAKKKTTAKKTAAKKTAAKKSTAKKTAAKKTAAKKSTAKKTAAKKTAAKKTAAKKSTAKKTAAKKSTAKKTAAKKSAAKKSTAKKTATKKTATKKTAARKKTTARKKAAAKKSAAAGES